MRVLIFSTPVIETFLILRIQRDIVINVKTSSCKVPVILIGFYWKLNYLSRLSRGGGRRAQISNFIKFRPVGAELFHADGHTDTTNLTVTFHNSANTSKNWNMFQHYTFS
jgi:hypothetical protein